MHTYTVTESRIKEDILLKKENEVLRSVEDYSKKLYSTFDLIYEQLRDQDNNVVFIPNDKGNNCGTVKTFNFKLTKEELSSDNNKYIFEHGNNKVVLEEKFPLCGVINNKDNDCYMTEFSKNTEAIKYINLIKKYLDYYVLDRDATYVYKDGKLIIDYISEQDFKNREINGYSYINK